MPLYCSLPSRCDLELEIVVARLPATIQLSNDPNDHLVFCKLHFLHFSIFVNETNLEDEFLSLIEEPEASNDITVVYVD